MAGVEETAESVAPTLSESINTKLHQILLESGTVQHNDLRLQIQQDISPDDLEEARKSLFKFAVTKHSDKTQHGDVHCNAQGTNIGHRDQLILKSRRSIEAVIDDVIELYLYLTGYHSRFPKACLSSTKLKTTKLDSLTGHGSMCAGNDDNICIPVTQKEARESIREFPVNSELRDLRVAIIELRSEVSLMRAQIDENHDLRSQIRALDIERKNLQTAIDLLTSDKSQRQQSPTANPLSFSTNDKDTQTKRQIPPARTPTNHKSHLQMERPTTSGVKLTPSDVTVPLVNRFAPLTDLAGDNYQEPTPEEIIDQYYDELIDHSHTPPKNTTSSASTSNATGVSFQQQMDEYRAKQMLKFKDRSASASSVNSVILLGDSMVKRIKGQKLSQSKLVNVISRSGAKVEHLSNMIMDGSIQLQTHELIVHVGTNNTQENAETISKKLESLCQMAQQKHDIENITISSIIHRKRESKGEYDKIVSTNKLVQQICYSHNWKFINNDNIHQGLLASDGVHLGHIGITTLARNLIRHLRGLPPSTTCPKISATNNDRTTRGSLTPLSRTSAVSQMHKGEPLLTYAQAVKSRPGPNDGVPFHGQQDFHQGDWKTRKKHLTPSQQVKPFHPLNRCRPLPSQETEWRRYKKETMRKKLSMISRA